MRIILALAVLVITCTASAQTSEPCIDLKLKTHIRELTLEGIDDALKDHVRNLFGIWLKDYSPEPQRAVKGMTNGISAYQRARANALKWDPLVCKE